MENSPDGTRGTTLRAQIIIMRCNMKKIIATAIAAIMTVALLTVAVGAQSQAMNGT